MKQFILMLSMLSLLLLGAWGCSEQSDQSAKALEEKATDAAETVQAGTVKATDDVAEKAKKVIEELQVAPQGTTEETK